MSKFDYTDGKTTFEGYLAIDGNSNLPRPCVLVGHAWSGPSEHFEQIAKDFMAELTQQGVFEQPIVTEVAPLQNYVAAEDYHQDYFARNPYQGYCLAVAAPKVAKFRETFARLVKA